MKKLSPPEECANCGGAIPRTAHACPECGADERTGWRETSLYDGIDLPASAWSEDEAAPKHPARTRRVNGLAWYWWCVGVVLALLLIAGFMRLF